MGTVKVTNIEPIADNGTVTLGSSGDTIAQGTGVFSKLGVFESQLLHVQDEKATGTSGGTFNNGAWRTRTINTVKTNEITGASLASDQITLPAGTYYIEASAPGYRTDRHQVALYNRTDSAFEIDGTSEYTLAASAVQTRSTVCGRFTITAQKKFEIMHRGETTQTTYGFGVESNFGQNSIYTDVKIWRVA